MNLTVTLNANCNSGNTDGAFGPQPQIKPTNQQTNKSKICLFVPPTFEFYEFFTSVENSGSFELASKHFWGPWTIIWLIFFSISNADCNPRNTDGNEKVFLQCGNILTDSLLSVLGSAKQDLISHVFVSGDQIAYHILRTRIFLGL